MLKDVKHPFDIPNIETLTKEIFTFDFYEPMDRTFGYSLTTTDTNFDLYRIVISIENIPTLLKEDELSNFITLDNIEYLSFADCIKNESYHYRPLVDEADKNY